MDDVVARLDARDGGFACVGGEICIGCIRHERADILDPAVMDKLAALVKEPDMEEKPYDAERIAAISPVLRALYGEKEPATVKFTTSAQVLSYDPTTKSLSPDHIVYAKAKQLAVPADADADQIRDLFLAFVAENGYKPRIVFVKDLGMFACGLNEKEAVTAQSVMLDAIQVVAYTASFGGVSPMAKELVDFILGWEVERYRSKVSLEK